MGHLFQRFSAIGVRTWTSAPFRYIRTNLATLEAFHLSIVDLLFVARDSRLD